MSDPKMFIISAKPAVIQGRDDDALNPADLYQLVKAQENTVFIAAELSDLFAIQATDEAVKEISSKIKGWDIFPGAPAAQAGWLPEGAPPSWLENPPVWKKRQEPAASALPHDFTLYVMKPAANALHPRGLQAQLVSLEGVRLLKNDTPFEWMIAATPQGLAALEELETGWAVTPYTAPSLSPRKLTGPSL